MQEIRCKKCGKLLYKADNIHNYLIFQQGENTGSIDLPAAVIETQCPRCKEMNTNKV